MKHIVRKPFWNFEKEEVWLNDMAGKGLALSNYSWCRYEFEDTQKGEYTYRIELLDKAASHPKIKEYITFLEEMGIEFVASYMRWIYLRKKAANGPFDLYSDIDSKIKHYKKVLVFWRSLAGLEISVAVINNTLGLHGGGATALNLALGCILLLLGGLFFGISLPVGKKLNALKKEREVREI